MCVQKYLTTLLLLIAVPFPAWAGGLAHIQADGATTLIEFDGLGAMRLEQSDEPDVYMIMRDDRIYSVVEQAGTAFVIELGAALGKMSDDAPDNELFGADVKEVKAFRKTERKETVATIRGDVYELDYVDNSGDSGTETLVLSDDPVVYELTQATMAMSYIMMRAAQIDKSADLKMMEQSILGEKLGVLRYGKEYVVSSIEESSPEAARFKLPAQPMDLDGVGGKGW
ncbi:hypothetical protein [Marinobacterium marinum]|uniref:DUF4412 domain-containing protein n=1 Tax=Marinobacterium marinum TaxID=2756129 RepID=A0A7W1WX52_9GAMM|nr:hypothetical protein [Marinobacterium marinum]MBA4501827.1 hypothetical protein [Marinobacterium marinum]